MWRGVLGPIGRGGRFLRGRGRRGSPRGRTREQAVAKRRLVNQTPLHDAGVLPPRGDQVAVVVQEADVGHMTAVGAVLMAGGLKGAGY